jgi:hypothetical protein
MGTSRGTAFVVGVLFLVTEVTAIAGKLLYGPVRDAGDYVVGAGADAQVALAGLLELMLVVAVVGTGVALYPVLRRQSTGLALGYALGRLLEGAVITVGVVAALSVVTLRQEGAGAEADVLVPAAAALGAVHDWTFVLGPNFILGVNSLVLAFLMYRSRLVPRVIAVLGLVGGPLVCVSGVAVMFGLWDADLSTPSLLMPLPVFAWEVSLAVYLIVKGFRPTDLTSDAAHPVEPRPRFAPA